MTILEIAQDYIARGWNPVPIPYRKKKPVTDGWQQRIVSTETAHQYFNSAPMNIGVQLGANSRGLTDVDLDCPEACAIAPYILPRTDAMFGRASARATHWLYQTNLCETEDAAVYQFVDPAQMILPPRIGQWWSSSASAARARVPKQSFQAQLTKTLAN
jgi:hypothetical protein